MRRRVFLPLNFICLLSFLNVVFAQDVDEDLAPIANYARIESSSKYLRDYAKTFDEINLQLVFRGLSYPDGDPRTALTITWQELRDGYEMLWEANFNRFVRDNLSSFLRGKKKMVMVTHGFVDGGANTDNCIQTWASDLAEKIASYEYYNVEGGKTVTVAICWNSHRLREMEL